MDFKTLADLAQLSVVAYGDPNNSTHLMQRMPANWTWLSQTDLGLDNMGNLTISPPGVQKFLPQGYYNFSAFGIDLQAYAAFNSATQEVVVAFRGTEGLSLDLVTDVGIMVGSLDLSILGIGDFIDAVISYAQSHSYTLLATGHSLGGALAEKLVQTDSHFNGGAGFGSPGISPLPFSWWQANNSSFIHVARDTDPVGTLFPASHHGTTLTIDDKSYQFGILSHDKLAYVVQMNVFAASSAFLGADPAKLGSIYVADQNAGPLSGVITSSVGAVIGTPLADSIDGSSRTSTLRIAGTAGDDVIIGGWGGDYLDGGSGDDALDGGSGTDDIRGGAGVDVLRGGANRDYLFGGIGNDELYGDDGNDFLKGEDGDDLVSGGASWDEIYGDAGNDVLIGGGGRDSLYGGVGADTFAFGAELLTSSGIETDIIKDFNQGNNGSYDPAEGDVIDITALVAAAGGTGKQESELWRLSANSTPNGEISVLEVDPDGSGGTYGWITVAELVGVESGAQELKVISGGGTVRISVCGRAVDHQAAMALMKRSPKITANCALAIVHSRGGIFHSFSERFKIK